MTWPEAARIMGITSSDRSEDFSMVPLSLLEERMNTTDGKDAAMTFDGRAPFLRVDFVSKDIADKLQEMNVDFAATEKRDYMAI